MLESGLGGQKLIGRASIFKELQSQQIDRGEEDPLKVKLCLNGKQGENERRRK